jgi:hypothetical protein
VEAQTVGRIYQALTKREKPAKGKEIAGRLSFSLICLIRQPSPPMRRRTKLRKVIASGLSRAILTRPGISGRNIWASQLNTSKCVRFGCQEFYLGLENIVRKCLRFDWLCVSYKSIVLEVMLCPEFAIIVARSRCSAIPCRTPII